MNQPIQISNGWVAATIAALVFDILYPLALGVFARRRLGVSWRYFGYGALIFVLFQLVSRVPITLAIQALIAPQLQASRVALIAWIAISALTAGMFEEFGRYVGYRWLLKREQKTWAKGVMYGLGHGGIESMLLIAGLVAITLIQVLALARTDLSTLPLTAEQRALAAQQLAAIPRSQAGCRCWAPGSDCGRFRSMSRSRWWCCKCSGGVACAGSGSPSWRTHWSICWAPVLRRF